MKTTLQLLTILLILQIVSAEQAKHQLKGISIFIRHGARAPYIEDFYKDQWQGLKRGDLTTAGQKQLENLGKKLREVYIENPAKNPNYQVFPKEYNKSFVKVKFAFISRCLMSLLGFLKGLYPELYNYKENVTPEELKEPTQDLGFSFDFNDYAGFQRDLLFRANDKKNCQLMKHVQEKRLQSDKFQSIFVYFRDHPQMKTIIEKLQKYRKEQDPSYEEKPIELTSMFHIKEIYDSYLMNKKHGKPVPDWDELEIRLLQMQYEHFFFRFFGFHEAKMLEASQFFDGLRKIGFEIYEKPDNERKLYIFSGTKTNIAIFISSILTKEQIITLGDRKIAPLSAYIAFEFWESEHGEKYVKLKYGDEDLELLQCRKPTMCTYQEFKILVKTKIYRNLETICDQDPSPDVNLVNKKE